MTGSRTTIILVNWNGYRDTLACLRSLLKLPETDFCVVVCDNGSTDGSIDAIVKWADDALPASGRSAAVVVGSQVGETTLEHFLSIVDSGANLGFARANNIGIRLALRLPSTDSVWILNNDTEVEPSALAALRGRMRQDDRIGICGSTLIYDHDRRFIQAVGVQFCVVWGYGKPIGGALPVDRLPQRDEVERKITYISGASMLVSRRFLETVGFMDENLFLYGEELSWSLKNRKRFRLAWAPDSIVYHKEGASIGSSSRKRASDKSIYYQNLSILRVTACYVPYYLPFVLLRTSARAVYYVLQGDRPGGLAVRRAIRDFFCTRGAVQSFDD